MQRIALLAALTALASSNVINYQIHVSNDNEVNECIERAMEVLMEETCLFFRSSSEDSTEDTCVQLLAGMLDANFPRQHVAAQLNTLYNCTEKCTTVCENGGELREDCTCKCGYGFTGIRCEQLARQSAFTDATCGVVHATSSGVVALSTFPDSRPQTTFCQWLIKSDDAWGLIDAEIEVLGLDDVDVSPNQNCNDLLSFYGTKDVKGTVPCDGTYNVTHVRSTSNWLLVELRANPFSGNSFTGPKIRYSVIRAPSAVRVYSEGMTAATTTTSSAALVGFLAILASTTLF